MVRKCAVHCCQTTKGPFFSFPNPYKDEERCLMWVSASGNPIFLKMGKEQLKHKVICKQHFATNCLYSKKLTPSAVPTLKLPSNKFTYQQHNDATITIVFNNDNFYTERKLSVEPNISPENMDVTATINEMDLRIQAPVDEYHLNLCKFYLMVKSLVKIVSLLTVILQLRIIFCFR